MKAVVMKKRMITKAICTTIESTTRRKQEEEEQQQQQAEEVGVPDSLPKDDMNQIILYQAMKAVVMKKRMIMRTNL